MLQTKQAWEKKQHQISYHTSPPSFMAICPYSKSVGGGKINLPHKE